MGWLLLKGHVGCVQLSKLSLFSRWSLLHHTHLKEIDKPFHRYQKLLEGIDRLKKE